MAQWAGWCYRSSEGIPLVDFDATAAQAACGPGLVSWCVLGFSARSGGTDAAGGIFFCACVGSGEEISMGVDVETMHEANNSTSHFSAFSASASRGCLQTGSLEDWIFVCRVQLPSAVQTGAGRNPLVKLVVSDG